MANQVDFKILPSDQFNVYSPQTRSDKVITYFTLLSKLRGDILSVGGTDDPNNIVSAYYTNVGNTQTLHLVKADGSEVTASNSYAGTVTSVDMSVPTGFAISGNPITTSGTLNVSFASGYSLPTDAMQADWTTAYNNSIVSAAVTGTSTKTLTLNQQDSGTITATWTDLGLTSVGLTMPAAFNVANSPLTSNGTIAVSAAGLSSQYIRGDGQLANFPSGGGGGSAVSYYLNGSVTQGTFGGVTYYELSRTPISGAGTDFTRTNAQGNGYIASFITDANDPELLNVPGGNWNLEFFFSASSSGGAPAFYGELYKVDLSNNFTLISSGSLNQETITGGTSIDQYYTSIAVPQTSLLATDRIAIRVYVVTDGRSITLHTENSHFCEVITTFSTGLNALNGLTDQVQYFAVGTSGTDFNISSVSDTHTFNIPTASASNRGLLSSSDWSTFNSKASDSFKTIAVTGQSNVVADSATDTLTFEAGTNIVITTDAATDKITISALGGGSGSVTSVDMSVPTGFSISGNPITTSGTLALAFASGYSLPTNASQTNWDTAYNNSITAFSYNTSTGVLTLTQQDAGTLTATITLQPFTTDNLTQGSTNLYDKVVSLTGAGTTVVTGTYPNFTITSNDQHTGTVTSIATSAPITGGTITTTGTIGITQSGASADGYLSSTDWNTFNSKVGGSGTVNYVSKWTSTGAIGNSQIFDTGTYVGINTATPAAKLDISGAHVASIGLLRLNASASNVAAQTYYIDGVYKAATYAGTDDNFYILGRDADIVFSTTSSTTTRMVITNGGNVGIGTGSPTQKLMVSGSVRVTGGYYDSSNSIGSNGQVLASTGSGTVWINASGGTVNGSGTVNYVPKWTGTTLLADSQIFDNGTNVGVGTATPNRKLTVSGNGTLLGLQSSTAGGYSEMEFTADGVSAAYIFKLSSGNSSYAGAGSFNIYNAGAIGFHTASVSNAMFIASATGNIGLGSTGPSQKLHVEGNIRVTGAYYDSSNAAGTSGQVLSSTGTGTSWITPFSGSGTTNYVAKWTSGTAIGNSSIYDNGNVGIGTATPAEKLQVNGMIRITNPTTAGIEYHNTNGTWELYIGTESGGSGARYNSASSKHTFYNNSSAVLSIVSSNVGIGTTSPSRLLHVAGNAQVDGWLFQGGYYTGSITLPSPSANYGNGRIYLRLCSSASGRIMTAKVRISSTWNWAPAFGSVEADISFYWTGSSLAYAYVNILSATGQAATNLTFGALEVEGGSISVPVYSVNSNPIYAYIQLSPDADPSQVSYSTWSSVAFPGQANVYVQTSLGVGTTSPTEKLHVSGRIMASGSGYVTNPAAPIFGQYTADRGYVQVPSNGRFEIWNGGTYEIATFYENLNSIFHGNVGIGNTTPSQKLHVTGNVRVTGAYYDSSNAAGTSGQILSSTGTGTAWISPGGGGGIITGSGTTNYVTKWTGSSAVGDSSIFDNGNVGIGTASPNTKLRIQESGTNPPLAIQNTNTDGYSGAWIYNSAGTLVGHFGWGNGTTTPLSDKMYFGTIAAKDVVFTTNDSEKVRITSTGNVGIGTTSPGSKLQVETGGDGNVLQLKAAAGNTTDFGFDSIGGYIETNGTTTGRQKLRLQTYNGSAYTQLFIDGGNQYIYTSSNVKVGIGTTSPESLLHLSQASTGGDGAFLFIDNPASSTLGNTAGIRFATNAGASFSGYGSFIQAVNTNAGNGAESLTFGTWNGASRGERMRILDNGNVGINTTSPAAKLDVIGSIRSYGGLISNGYHGDTYIENLLPAANNGAAQGDVQLRMWCSEPGITWSWAGFGYNVKNDGASPYGFGRVNTSFGQAYMRFSTDGNLYFYNTNTSGTRVETMTLTNGGGVGIGTSSPSQALHVSGNIRVTGAYYDSSNAAGTSGQILSSTGSGTAWIAAPSGGGVSGSGTTNYVAKWTSGSAVGNSSIYDNGNVGIGTTSPNAKLVSSKDVSSNDFNNLGAVQLKVTGSTSYSKQLLIGFETDNNYGLIQTLQDGVSWSSYNLSIQAKGGNVGIGTTAPLEKLHVAGNEILGDVGGSSIGYNSTIHTGAGNQTAGTIRAFYGFTNPSGVYVNVGDAWAWKIATVARAGNSGNYNSQLEILRTTRDGVTDATTMAFSREGNVGIGTTAPGYKLDVNGVTRFQDQVRFKTDVWQISDSDAGNRFYFSPGGRTYFGSGDGYEWRNSSDSAIAVITNGGNVGIGTTSPVQKLSVDGAIRLTSNPSVTGDGSSVQFWNQAGVGATIAAANFQVRTNGDTTALHINSSQNVGIGTTAPNNALTINRDTGAGNISSMPGVVFRNKNTTNSIFVHSGIFADTYRDVADPHYSGGIWFTRIPLVSNLTSGSDIIFGTGGFVTSGAFPDERMRITWDGAVGIGATAPTTTLDVRRNVPASSGTFPVLRVGNSSGDWGNYSMIEASNVPDGRAVRFGAYIGASNYSQGGFAVVTGTNGDIGSSPSIKFFVRHDGNVGIGTTSPTVKLHVADSNGGRLILQGVGGSGINWQLNSYTDGKLYIGNYGVSDYVTLTSTGNVGIGTTAPAYLLDVSGTIRATGDVIAYSDARVKENVETLDGALDKVMKMRGVSYNKIGENEKKVGVIAQEILEVLPEVVSQDETGTYSVAYGNISAVLIEAIKELTNTVKEQQKQIDELKAKLK